MYKFPNRGRWITQIDREREGEREERRKLFVHKCDYWYVSQVLYCTVPHKLHAKEDPRMYGCRANEYSYPPLQFYTRSLIENHQMCYSRLLLLIINHSQSYFTLGSLVEDIHYFLKLLWSYILSASNRNYSTASATVNTESVKNQFV